MYGAYNGGSGHTDPDTSQSAEEYRDTSGITDIHQKKALQILQNRERTGATAQEIADSLQGVEKGRISTALTNLHIGEFVQRLATRREHHYVYVLPRYVDGREVKPYVPQSYHLHTEEGIERAEKLAQYLNDRTAFGGVPLSGDKEVARALRYMIAVSRRNQRAEEQAREAATRR